MSNRTLVAPPRPVVAGDPPPTRPVPDYRILKRLVRDQGLLQRQPVYLVRQVVTNGVLLALGIAWLFLADSLWLQLPNMLLMAFVFGQMGFVTHDVGHRQAFRSVRTNNVFGLIHGNLMLGMSLGWWMDKHNQHHANPNQHDLDPDIGMVVLAFSQEDALTRRGLFRFMVRHQAFFFFPLLLFQAWSLHVGSVGYLLSGKSKNRGLELLLLVLHFVWFPGLLIAGLGLWQGLAFFFIQQALFGFYMAMVFAPNHKGMLVLDGASEIGFLEQQVLTARNVIPHPVVDYWYGGLNYQIEHHLFPTLSRNQLGRAREIIKRYCQEHSVSYYETTIAGSYREILQYLHHVSAPLRKADLTG